MSSHREAPEISKDPVADNTDTYVFLSPDRDDTVTIITNYIPLQLPPGGPNFFEFGDDVLYRIHVDNDGDGESDITYEFRFSTRIRNPNSFLYATGPITSLQSNNWNRPQVYSVTRVEKGRRPVQLASGLSTPPCNIGFRSTPNYPALAQSAVHNLPGGGKVFAGQRQEGFYVDLGSIFDLGALRPFQNLHLIPSAAQAGVNATKDVSVHTIAIQVPINQLTRRRNRPSDRNSRDSVIGVYGSASRQRARFIIDGALDLLPSNLGGGARAQVLAALSRNTGSFMQVSRLANPLFNEVIVPMALKDAWNAKSPKQDSEFARFVAKPELAGLLPVLYPTAFPNLKALNESGKPRADLLAILLTGLPAGIVPNFQNFTGPVQADLLRLNVAVPATTGSPNPLGIIGGDLAGFPNGRRVIDDVVAIELRAIAGATYPLVDPSFVPDGAALVVDDGLTAASQRVQFLNTFPYLGVPQSGYDYMPAA